MSTIIESIARGETLTPEQTRQLMDDAPFFVLGPMIAMEQGETDTTVKAHAALAASSAEDMARLVNNDEALFTPDEPETPDTESTIDLFVRTYGTEEPDAESALLERLIFNPVPPDYASMLEMEATSTPSPAEPTRQQNLIDSFLDTASATPERPHASPAPPQPPSETGSLNESLAQAFIKKGEFQRAYDIICRLNLNKTEKSIYFADQLRFLQKLMLNDRRNRNKNKTN